MRKKMVRIKSSKPRTSAYSPQDADNIARRLANFNYDPAKTEEVKKKYEELLKPEKDLTLVRKQQN